MNLHSIFRPGISYEFRSQIARVISGWSLSVLSENFRLRKYKYAAPISSVLGGGTIPNFYWSVQLSVFQSFIRKKSFRAKSFLQCCNITFSISIYWSLYWFRFCLYSRCNFSKLDSRVNLLLQKLMNTFPPETVVSLTRTNKIRKAIYHIQLFASLLQFHSTCHK